MLRDAQPSDAPDILEIVNHYILNTCVTFDETPVDVHWVRNKIAYTREHYPYIVAEEEGRVVGYAYASAFRSKSAYRHTVESTVYLHPGSTGKGIGSQLYKELLERLQKQGVHTVVAVIGVPNPASERLHQKLGFHHAGNLSQVGFKHGKWLDTSYWVKALESASRGVVE